MIEELRSMEPYGYTYIGRCLDRVIGDYLHEYKASRRPISFTKKRRVKPISILVITDGAPSASQLLQFIVSIPDEPNISMLDDEPDCDQVIHRAVQGLKKLKAPMGQVRCSSFARLYKRLTFAIDRPPICSDWGRSGSSGLAQEP